MDYDFKIVRNRENSCDPSETAYNKVIEHVYAVMKFTFDFCTKKAVEEERKENEIHKTPVLNLKVSGDGSWKKRSFKSLFGVTTLIG